MSKPTHWVFRGALALVSLTWSPGALKAAPITYVQTGVASGTIGGTPFTDAFIVMTMTGDTAAVMTLEEGGFTVYQAFLNETKLSITGIGTATVTGKTAIFSIPFPAEEEGFPVSPFVFGGTSDGVGEGTGIGATFNEAFLGYDLRSSIGPVTGVGGIGYPKRLFVNTTLGELRFTENISPSSEGTFTATLTTPEPMSWLVIGCGLAIIGGARSRRSPTL